MLSTTSKMQIKGGGFVLGADDNNSVKQNLGGTINITGDGNTVTSVKDGKIEVGLNKDVDLGTDGSIAAGNTTINKRWRFYRQDCH